MPLSEQCTIHYSTEYCTCVLQPFLTNYSSFWSQKILFGPTESEISSCTFIVFTVLREFQRAIGVFKNNLQRVGLDEIANPAKSESPVYAHVQYPSWFHWA